MEQSSASSNPNKKNITEEGIRKIRAEAEKNLPPGIKIVFQDTPPYYHTEPALGTGSSLRHIKK